MNHLSPESMLDHLLGAADAAVTAHLRECRDCAAEFQALEAAQQATAEFYRAEPLPSARPFEDRILKSCSEKKSRWLKITALASLAAGLLLGSLYLASYFANRAVHRDIEATASTGEFRATRKQGIRRLDRLLDRIEHFKRGPSFIEWFLWVDPGSPDDAESLHGRTRAKYFSILQELILAPLGTILVDETAHLLAKDGKSLDDLERLYELNLACQILCGKMAPDDGDRDLPRRVLGDPRYVRERGYSNLWAQAFGDLHLQDMAHRHLEYYWTEFSARDSSRIPSYDGRLVWEVSKYLGGKHWPDAAYVKVRNVWERSWRAQYPDQGQSVFSDAAGSNRLKVNHTVPGFFTQDCFNGLVQPLLKEHAKNIARTYEKLGFEGTAKDVEDYLYDRYKAEYAAEWNKFLERIEVLPLRNMSDAKEALNDLGDAITKIITEVWSRRVIVIDGTPYNVPKRGTEWLRLANDKLAVLSETVGDFVMKTNEGQRFRDYVDSKNKLDLGAAFNTALSEMDTVVGSGIDQQDHLLRTAVMKFMPAPIHRAREALVREAGDELNRYWSKTALAHFKKTLAGKYPFVRTAEIDSTTKDFNEFFKPETGLLAKIEYYMKTLHDITIDENPLVKFTPEYETAVAYAQRLRPILYSLDKNTVSTRFTVQSSSPRQFGHILIKVKDKEVDLKSMIRYALPNAVWKEGQSVYFKLTDENRPTKVLYEDKPQTHWGLFRLCDSGGIKDKGTGKDFEISWEYLPNLTITLTLTCDDANNPFAPDFFSKFVCPEKVAE